MQSVSQEWIDNQSAIIRKPGFIVVNIPDVKISCGAVSHRIETTDSEVYYISDPLGCDYLDKCGISVTFDTTLLGSNSVSIISLNDKSEQLNSVIITASNLTNGSYYWETTGFSKIKIICETASVTDIQLYAYGIPRSDIQSYTHSRSYDPMGFELPTNDMTMDVYNYADKYTDFYKAYSNEGYTIIVYYGYKLDSGDEIILGGTFHLTDAQLVDNILTLTGESLLSFIDEKGSMDIFNLKATDEGCIYILVSETSSSRGTYTVDLTTREEFNISGEDIIAYLKDTVGIKITCNSEYTDKFISNTWFNASYLEMIQSLINFLLNRCFVDRNDYLHFDICNSTDVIIGNHILLLNGLENPTYSSTKKVRKFEATTTVNGEIQNFYDSGNTSSSSDKTYTYEMDCVNNRILKISMYSRGIYNIKIYPSYVAVYYRSNSSSYYSDFDIDYCTVVEGGLEEITVDTNGVICDIDSPLGKPSDYDKIVKYFSNRDLYTFNVRGNPARDVGDYVNVSLTNDDDTSTYKKGLVLSSILSYDGSFKEECTVRIIENDFE